jgi:hypothetical protein
MANNTPPKIQTGSEDLAIQEWNACRGIIDTLDGRLTDLRRYGFTLVTALFAVAGLISKLVSTSGTLLTPAVQFSVFVVTMVLTVTLFLIDEIYRSEQRAAEFRARVLETHLNLELTETTAKMYKGQRAGLAITFALIEEAKSKRISKITISSISRSVIPFLRRRAMNILIPSGGGGL